ncbi:MAG TPA: protein kinase [Candidatus Hydrogenedentes bacterium]|nr:protein kinase [Candidatus Hydrogenedentota bacterium]
MEYGSGDLLFGLLAAQFKGLSIETMSPAVSAWEKAPHIPLWQHCIETSILGPDDVRFVDRLAEALIHQHGSADQALETFGGPAYALELLGIAGKTQEETTAPITKQAPPGFFEQLERRYEGLPRIPGRYTLVKEHARGGMGRVLVVHDERLDRQVAMKELLTETDYFPEPTHPSPRRYAASTAARFIREAQVAGRLEHPSIVPVYELGESQDGHLFYTMKLVRGKTLHDTLKERKDVVERLKLLSHFQNLCQAIAYAHSRGVIHRDIKPANVMLGEFGETVVLDWGIAKIKAKEDVSEEKIREELEALDKDATVEMEDTKTKDGMRLGTPHYMAPEQARGDIAAIDERSDVYALGSVLYEILTGKTPFSGKTTHEILQKVVNSSPESVFQTVSDAPPELVKICEKAMRKDPAERYQSAIELANDIHRFIAGMLVSAYKYSVKEVLFRYYRQHRMVVNTAAGFVLVLAVLGIYSYISIMNARDREHAQREVAERQGYLTQLGLMQAAIKDQDHITANKVAEKTLPAQRGWEWSYLLSQANPELRTVTAPPGERFATATYSPDGMLIATMSNGQTVKLWNSETGALKLSCEGNVLLSIVLRFSPDGKYLAGASQDGTVKVWVVDSGKLLHTLTGHKEKAIWAEFTPDNTKIVSAATDGTSRIWDVQSGALITTIETGIGPLGKVVCAPNGKELALISPVGGIMVWDMTANNQRFVCGGEDAVFNNDGTRLATCGGGFTALFDTATGKELRRWTTPNGRTLKVRFSPDASRLLTACEDGVARLYEETADKEIQYFNHRVMLRDAFFARNGSVVVTCADNNTFAVWDTASGSLLNHLEGQGNILTWVDSTQDGNRMVTTTTSEYFQIWDPLYQTSRRFLMSIVGDRPKIALCEKTHQVALQGTDGFLHVVGFDASTNHDLYAANPVEAGFGKIAFSDNGDYLACAADAFSTVIWDLMSKKVLHKLPHAAQVTSITFDPAGRYVGTAGEDGKVCLWETASGSKIRAYSGHAGFALAVSFSSDGKHLASAGMDGQAIIWDVNSDTPALTIMAHEAPVRSITFNPDGKHLLTASDDLTVGIWDTKTGERVGTLQGHNNSVLDVAMDNSGKYIYSTAGDQSSRIWDAASLELLITLPGVACVRYSESINTLITAQFDGPIECWNLPGLDKIHQHGPVQSLLETFKRLHYKETLVNPPLSPKNMYVTVTKETLGKALRQLAKALNTEQTMGVPDQDTKGLTLSSEQRWEPVLPIGVGVDDTLVQLGAQSIHSRADTLAALQPLIQQEFSNLPDTLDIQVKREGNTLLISLITAPRISSTQQVQVSWDQTLVLLKTLKDNLIASMYPAEGLEYHPHQPYIKYRHNVVYSKAPEGKQDTEQIHLILDKTSEKDKGSDLFNVGLAYGDRLTAIDGVGFPSFQEAISRLDQLRDTVEKKSVSKFGFTIQRGEFESLQIDYTIQP